MGLGGDGEALRGEQAGQAGKKASARWRLVLVWFLRLLSVFWLAKGLMAWMVIFTPGFAASKSATVDSQYALPSPVVELCQKVIDTLPPAAAELVPPVLLLPPLLQAVSARAPIDRAAVATRNFLPFIRSVLFVELHRVESSSVAGRTEDRRCYRRTTRHCRRSASSPVLRPPRGAVTTVVSGAVFFIEYSWSSSTGGRRRYFRTRVTRSSIVIDNVFLTTVDQGITQRFPPVGHARSISPPPDLARAQGQIVVISPPSIVKSAPVMFMARSLARKRTRSATSSGRVNRPVTLSAAAWAATAAGSTPLARAIVAATPSAPSHSSVATGPGLIVLTRIPRGPTSLDSALQKLVKAALDAL